MTENLRNTIILAGAFLLLFATAELLYHRFKVKAEVTRKVVHISTGLLSLLFPLMLGHHTWVLLLCGSFLVILLSSLKFNLLPSINGVDRITRGSILYPLIVYGCFLAMDHYNVMMMYYLPILILAISDPIAAFVGKKIPWKTYTTFGQSKTLSGSLGFLFSSIVIVLIAFTPYIVGGRVVSLYVMWVIVAVVISLPATIAEALTHKGYDNLTIPGTVLFALILFKEYTGVFYEN